MVAMVLHTLLNLFALTSIKEPNVTTRNNLPQEKAEINFYLHELNATKSIKNCDFSTTTKTPLKIIIPDCTDTPESPWIAQMTNTMSRKNRWHVITMDYKDYYDAHDANANSKMAGINFRSALENKNTARIDPIASRLANFTIDAIKANRLTFKWVHFIGHGVGALIAIQAAHEINALTGKRISRLTALDPNMLLLTTPRAAIGMEKLEKLKDAAAHFVDVIHTNADERGTFDPFGHVDFYPNGGKSQPGCDANVNLLNFTPSTTTNSKDVPNLISTCNHNRACEYWTASILDAHVFRAFNYKLWRDYVEGRLERLTAQPMGIAANPTMPWGAYFLETKDGVPYVIPYNKTM